MLKHIEIIKNRNINSHTKIFLEENYFLKSVTCFWYLKKKKKNVSIFFL